MKEVISLPILHWSVKAGSCLCHFEMEQADDSRFGEDHGVGGVFECMGVCALSSSSLGKGTGGVKTFRLEKDRPRSLSPAPGG